MERSRPVGQRGIWVRSVLDDASIDSQASVLLCRTESRNRPFVLAAVVQGARPATCHAAG